MCTLSSSSTSREAPCGSATNQSTGFPTFSTSLCSSSLGSVTSSVVKMKVPQRIPMLLLALTFEPPLEGLCVALS